MKYIKNIKSYIRNIDSSIDTDIITVEHRSNNNKRDFLFANKIQCKHIPAKPTEMIAMCNKLAELVNKEIKHDDKVMVIAFAETATAIGDFVAYKLNNCDYVLHTTREDIDNCKQLITFEEEH